MLLWRGIAQYATAMGLRYLLGCSSLNSNDPAEGWQMYRQLEGFRVSAEFETDADRSLRMPPRKLRFESAETGRTAVVLPERSIVARGYFSGARSNSRQNSQAAEDLFAIGARIAAPPAWDREFGTIDFLTLLDLNCFRPRPATASWLRFRRDVSPVPARCGAGLRSGVLILRYWLKRVRGPHHTRAARSLAAASARAVLGC